MQPFCSQRTFPILTLGIIGKNGIAILLDRICGCAAGVCTVYHGNGDGIIHLRCRSFGDEKIIAFLIFLQFPNRIGQGYFANGQLHRCREEIFLEKRKYLYIIKNNTKYLG